MGSRTGHYTAGGAFGQAFFGAFVLTGPGPGGIIEAVYKNFPLFQANNDTIYRCLVFSFVEYKKGKEKEVITFFISDDKNHLPI